MTEEGIALVTSGQGHSVQDDADAIVEFATIGANGPTGAFLDRNGTID